MRNKKNTEENNAQKYDSIQEFKSEFDTYYKYFSQFYNGGINKKSKYILGHPELITSSYKLQAKYAKLPRLLRERLIEMEFEVFLHCTNIVDFYSFRQFIIENNLFYTLATIVERVDGELNTALEIFKLGGSKLYKKLPKRNYTFYREYSAPKVMGFSGSEVNESLSDDREDEINTDKSNGRHIKSSIGKSFIEALDEAESVATKADNIVKSSLSIVSLVVKYFSKLL